MLEVKFKHNKEEEKEIFNQKQILNINNEKKLSLRKNKNIKKLQSKRDTKIEHLKFDYNNINPEFIFKLNNLGESYNIIYSNLNSNNKDLISYTLNELKIYFSFSSITVKDQKVIDENNFFELILHLGNQLLQVNDMKSIKIILDILINIQVFEEGSAFYLKKLYTNSYFDFFNMCLIAFNKNEIFYSIEWILLNMSNNDHSETFNLALLRSSIFSTILKFINENANNILYMEDKELYLKLCNCALDLSSIESLLEAKDVEVINECLLIIIKDLLGSCNDVILGLIYEGLYYISNLDDSFNFNKKLIEKGVTKKILKSQFYNLNLNSNNKKIILYALRIIANNLTLSENECQIIYDLKIIDFYDTILVKFDDDFAITEAVFNGLSNISVGKNKSIIKNSIIFSEKKIEKYCNSTDEIRILFIKIIIFLIYDSNYETLMFISKTKILEYLIYLFSNNNLSHLVSTKILKVIDNYLKRFKNENKENKEYLIIYHKFKELFDFCNKINDLNSKELISSISKNIENNYN